MKDVSDRTPQSTGKPENPASGFALMATAACSSQTGAAFGSRAFDSLGPVGVVAVRQIVAAVILSVISRPRLWQFTRSQWGPIILLALIFAVMNTALYASISRVGLGMAVTLEFLGPLAVAIGSSRRLRDGIGALLALGGVVLLTQPGPTSDFLGIGLGLLAGVCWAGYILTNRVVGRRIPGVQGAAAATILSATGMLPAVVVIIYSFQPPWQAYVFALLAGLFSTAVPYALDLIVLRRISPLIFGLGMSLHPFFAALIGMVFLGEALGVLAWSGIALVIAANTVTLLASRGEPEPVTASLDLQTGAHAVVPAPDSHKTHRN